MSISTGETSPVANLNPNDRATFATSARLISCLVTESLVQAFYYPLSDSSSVGFSVISLGDNLIDEPKDIADILAIVSLRNVPLLKRSSVIEHASKISLLDPMDMAPFIFITEDPTDQPFKLHTNIPHPILENLFSKGWLNRCRLNLLADADPKPIWRRFGNSIKVDSDVLDDIESELLSAIKWQTYSYEHPPVAPLFTSPSIEWEQSIVEGHPTHPMHKTRRFLPPIPDLAPRIYDLYHPNLRLIAMPKTSMKITYNFEELLEPIIEAVCKRVRKPLVVPEDYIVVPVHELQLYHIADKVSEAIIFSEEYSLPLLAQQSLRSVVVPDVYHNLHLKLGVGIKLTSAVRTISPESAYLGPRFSAQVVPVLTMDPNVITVAKELASVVYSHPNGEIAKHCAALIREFHEGTSDARGERLIVCTSLMESGHIGPNGHLPSIIRVFELDTEEKCIAWLTTFVDVFFQAFLPPVLHNGVAFECHPQNCVARFDLQTKMLKGFIIRDFGGLRVHPETLKASTGVELDFMSGHSIIAPDLEDVYTRMYHTVFHNHLQQLIRVLGLHYNGRGWTVVRECLSAAIPCEHPLHEAWLSPKRTTLPGKCFMRMRMSGLYRHHLHGPFPNLIHYRGVEHANQLSGHSTKHLS